MDHEPKVYPVTRFRRNARKHVQRLKETGRPEILTVRGEAAVVIQSAAAYQALVDRLERARSLLLSSGALERGSGAGATPSERSLDASEEGGHADSPGA